MLISLNHPEILPLSHPPCHPTLLFTLDILNLFWYFNMSWYFFSIGFVNDIPSYWMTPLHIWPVFTWLTAQFNQREFSGLPLEFPQHPALSAGINIAHMMVLLCLASGIPTQEHSFWKDMGCFCPSPVYHQVPRG